MTAHRDFHSGDLIKPPEQSFATLRRGDTSVSLTPEEFHHLLDCFGLHGFQPDTENCGLCQSLAARLGFFNE